MPNSPPPVPSGRLVVITAEVRERLTDICSTMPRPLFELMVQRIARVQLAFEGLPLKPLLLW